MLLDSYLANPLSALSWKYSALGSLSGRFTNVEYTVTEEDRNMVYNLAEDIRNAIFEYQVSRYLGVVSWAVF